MNRKLFEMPVHIEVFTAEERGAESFAVVLIEGAEWLEPAGRPMWKASDLTVEKLLKSYVLNEMKLCYDNNELVGVLSFSGTTRCFGRSLRAKSQGFCISWLYAVNIEEKITAANSSSRLNCYVKKII